MTTSTVKTRKVVAHKVDFGDYVLHPNGQVIKILASYADVGRASASATTWHVEGYPEHPKKPTVPTGPTVRIRCDPDEPIDVLMEKPR